MGIFDPDEVITIYSLEESIEDGVLVEVFKNRWKELSGGKPIVASVGLFEAVSEAALEEIWKRFVFWQKYVRPKWPEEERWFSTEVDYIPVWVIDDKVCFTILYPEDY